MSKFSFLALLAIPSVLAFALLSVHAGDMDKELKKMQGTWKVVKSQVDGKNIPLTAFAKVTVVIVDDKIAFKDHGKTFDEVEFKLDPTARPSEIDYRYIFGLKKGVREAGIYRWNGDQLTICMSHGKQKRPADFEGKQQAGVQLLTLKRADP